MSKAAPHLSHPEYSVARELMSTMVENSQRPGEGNEAFMQAMSAILKKYPLPFTQHQDPAYNNRSIMAVDVGDPEGEQVLATVSHSDVVGVDGQHWSSMPWKLRETDEMWFGRGTCDTHGTGVSMLLAGLRPEVQRKLLQARKKVTIIFSYDEEAASAEFSMRGARMAAGLLGTESVIKTKNFVAGEPTELDGIITPMRAHKGRLLAHFRVKAPHAGHVSNTSQNAFMAGSSIVHEIGEYGRMLHYGSRRDAEAQIFDPPYSTVQVSAGEVKTGDYSTAPQNARFTLDMRTLPFVHRLRVDEMIDLITSQKLHGGEEATIEIVKDGEGSMTPADALIVRIAEAVTGQTARGFNGGDEGRIFRNSANMEGVTMGPGDLVYAHQPDERIRIASIFTGADVYSKLFLRSAGLPLE
ncbi:M20/M25/M40 family metallo-hydrolase [Candidatus Peregrinibacteria bacterium]|nr:M20/M25/M40 family metallo-hydrolase [Candidatus Peregrinibacteria bacterium]